MSRPLNRQTIVAAKAGDLVNPKLLSRIPGTEPLVAGACRSEGGGGSWVCNGCGEFFDNNLQSHLHKAGSKHPRVWWCREHGRFEVPT